MCLRLRQHHLQHPPPALSGVQSRKKRSSLTGALMARMTVMMTTLLLYSPLLVRMIADRVMTGSTTRWSLSQSLHLGWSGQGEFTGSKLNFTLNLNFHLSLKTGAAHVLRCAVLCCAVLCCAVLRCAVLRRAVPCFPSRIAGRTQLVHSQHELNTVRRFS